MYVSLWHFRPYALSDVYVHLSDVDVHYLRKLSIVHVCADTKRVPCSIIVDAILTELLMTLS